MEGYGCGVIWYDMIWYDLFRYLPVRTVQVLFRTVDLSVEIWTGTSQMEVVSIETSVPFLSMYYMLYSTRVWQMFGNENISHPVGTAACPRIVQQILALGRVEGSRTVRCIETAELSCWTSGHDWLDVCQVYHWVCIISRSLLWRSGFDFTAGRMNYCCFFSHPLRCPAISAAFGQTLYCDIIVVACSLGGSKTK